MSTDTEPQILAVYFHALDKERRQQLADCWTQLIQQQQEAAGMTSADTIELIISDLNNQRDAGGVVDTNSVLSILARINVLLWQQHGDDPLSADSLRQLTRCA